MNTPNLTSLIAFVLISAIATSANGVQVALHEGNNDPETEGWTKVRTFSNVAVFPVVNDLGLGIDAWALDDNGAAAVVDDGLYESIISAAEQSAATANGWILSGRIRTVDLVGDGFVFFGFMDGVEAYGLGFGESGGGPVLHLGGTSTSIDVSDLDAGYHLYQLVYDPLDGNADVLIDGILKFSDFAGVGGPFFDWFDPSVRFGSGGSLSTGQGNYNLVELNIVPEPSSLCLLGICFTALAFYRRSYLI